jgi:hypothetical protein
MLDDNRKRTWKIKGKECPPDSPEVRKIFSSIFPDFF